MAGETGIQRPVGGGFGRIAGHVFLAIGPVMVSMIIPLLLTANPFAQRKLGK